MNSKNKYYIKDSSSQLTPISEHDLQTYGYYMAGYQDPKDAGKLSTLQNIGGATCLVNVYDSKGRNICKPKYAGKYFKEINKIGE
jgi:hypothetical protein